MSSLSQSLLIVFIFSFVLILKMVDAGIVVPPTDFETSKGTSAIFNCSSSISGGDVQWSVYPVGKSMQVIYAYGKINTQYVERFTVQNGHNLHISSVAVEDAGTYECHDDYGHGEKHSAELVVLESNPVCESRIKLVKVVKKSTCDIEPNEVTLSCRVQYRGNKAPSLEWEQNGDEKTITSGVTTEVLGNLVLHNLTRKGDSIAGGSSYNCRSTKASTGVSCNSGTIIITNEGDDNALCYNYIYVVVFICICAIALPLCFVWGFFLHRCRKKRTKTNTGSESKTNWN